MWAWISITWQISDTVLPSSQICFLSVYEQFGVESLKPETGWPLSVRAAHLLREWLFNLMRLQRCPRSRLSQTFPTKLIPHSFAVCCVEVRGNKREAHDGVGAAPQQPWIHLARKPAGIANSLTAGDWRYVFTALCLLFTHISTLSHSALILYHTSHLLRDISAWVWFKFRRGDSGVRWEWWCPMFQYFQPQGKRGALQKPKHSLVFQANICDGQV